jgi:hypothetical protein
MKTNLINFLFLIFLLFFIENSYSQTYSWANKLGRDNSKSHTTVLDIKVDKNENFYISGSFGDTLNINLNQGVNNIYPSKPFLETYFVAKYDKQNNLIWIKTMSGIDFYFHYTFSIDSNDNIIIAASYNDTFRLYDTNVNLKSNGKNDFVILKFNQQGSLLWHKYFGGTQNDYNQTDIEISKQGNIYIHGVFGDSLFFPKINGLQQKTYSTEGRKDIFIMKLDSNGDRVWFNQIKCYKNNSESKGLTIDNEENIILIGRFEDSIQLADNKMLKANKFKQFILKMNDSGMILWFKTIESDMDYFNWLLDVKTDYNNNIYTTFSVTGDNEVVLKNDSFIYNSIRVKQSGILLFKLNPKGDYKWVRTFFSGRKDRRESCLYVSDKVYMVGTYVDSILIDSMNWKLKSKAGNSFLAIIDTMGTIISFAGPKIIGDISGRGGVSNYSLFVRENLIYTAGFFNVKSDFDLSRSSSVMDGSKGFLNKGFIAKYNTNIIYKDSIDIECYTSSVEEKNKLGNEVLYLYPNPTIDFLNIELSSIPNFVSIKVLDVIGREITTQEFQKQKDIKVDLSVMPKGIYLFKLVIDHSQNQYFKIIKE